MSRRHPQTLRPVALAAIAVLAVACTGTDDTASGTPRTTTQSSEPTPTPSSHVVSCLGGTRVDAGTSVRDLASLLAAQRHMKTSRPVPVNIGGHRGLYLTLTAPADLDRCRGGNVTIYTAGGAWSQWDIPDATFHEWILDVHGERVVGGTRISPHAAHPAELIHMVESATFSGADQP